MWGETEVAFVFDWPDTIKIYESLTLFGDVVFKVHEGITIDATEGKFVLGSGAYVTALVDDYWKGDSNGDGDTTAPWDGYWVGVKDPNDNFRQEDEGIYYDEGVVNY